MKYVREFDGVRGLLALWVLCAHAIELGPFSSVAGHLRPQFAVDIFIILSGFVIFHLLSQGEDYGTFITRRFFRLFPVFAVCFLFALVLRTALNSHDEIAFGLIGSPRLTPYLATHAAMLHGAVPEQWLPMSAEAILPPAWSISLEWQFYLVAPLLFMLLVKPRWSLALLLFGLVAMRALWERHSLGLLVPGGPRDLTFNMNAFLPLKLEFFAVGVLSWVLWRAFASGRLQGSARLGWLGWLGAPLVWCATDSVSLTLWTALFIFLMKALYGTPDTLANSLSALGKRPLRELGMISYSLYLIHVPTIVLVRYGLQKLLPNLAPLPFAVALFLFGMLFSLVLASLLHVAVERPMMAFGKRITARWRAGMVSENDSVAPALTVESSSPQSPG